MHNNIWEWHHYNGKQNWKTNIKVGDHLMKVLAVGARLGGAVRVAVAVGVAVGVAGVAGFVAGFVAGIVAGVVAGVGGGFVGGIRAYKKDEVVHFVKGWVSCPQSRSILRSCQLLADVCFCQQQPLSTRNNANETTKKCQLNCSPQPKRKQRQHSSSDVFSGRTHSYPCNSYNSHSIGNQSNRTQTQPPSTVNTGIART